jgi:hypothetical protein
LRTNGIGFPSTEGDALEEKRKRSPREKTNRVDEAPALAAVCVLGAITEDQRDQRAKHKPSKHFQENAHGVFQPW